MKKILLSLAFAVSLYSSTYQPTHAQWVVFDPAQYATQIPQFAKEIISTASNVLTQINTWEARLKIMMDPIANAMTAVTLLKQQANTINLVTGSLGGGNQLLISNPEEWVKKKGLDVVRISLGDVSNQTGPYTDSIFKSITGTFKSSNMSLKATLEGINSSSIPGRVQNNLCGDTQLTEVARNDVMKSDGTVDPTDLSTRKMEIYNSLCIGNPSSNPQLAQKLTQVGSQRPDIAGWDTWLAVTGGDNEYTKSVRATQAVSEKEEERRKAKEAELVRGGGLASPSKCIVTADTAPNSDPANISDALCRMESLTNTGSAVSASFQTALSAPMERLINSFGSGILSTLGTLLSARNTIGMLSNAFSGASSGGGDSNSDLAEDATNKKNLTSPILRRLTMYSSSLNKLEEASVGIRREIITTEQIAGQVESCYQKLIEDFSINEQYPGVGDAFSYSRSKKQLAVRLSESIDKDSSMVASARAFVSDMEARITASNSSEEINDIFSNFEEKIADGTFPSDSSGSLREAEYQTLKGDNQVDIIQGGRAFQLNAQCAAIRVELTPRDY